MILSLPQRYCLVLIAVLMAGGCNRAADTSYYPLGSDMSWEYRIEYRVREETRTQRLVFSTRPAVEVDKQRYYPKIGLNGHRDFYQKNDAGIVHVDPVSGERSRVLAYPIEKGQHWQEQSRIRILDVTGAFASSFEARIQQPITVDYQIDGTGESVSVPAGRFDDCVRVRGKGRLFAGKTLQDYMGIDSIFIEQTEWYAPGAGLVKTVRNEYTAPNEFRNTYTQELLALKRH